MLWHPKRQEVDWFFLCSQYVLNRLWGFCDYLIWRVQGQSPRSIFKSNNHKNPQSLFNTYWLQRKNQSTSCLLGCQSILRARDFCLKKNFGLPSKYHLSRAATLFRIRCSFGDRQKGFGAVCSPRWSVFEVKSKGTRGLLSTSWEQQNCLVGMVWYFCRLRIRVSKNRPYNTPYNKTDKIPPLYGGKTGKPTHWVA